MIVADNCKVICPAINFQKAVYLLTTMYYIEWLSYQKAFSQILGLLQQYALNEQFTEAKSKRFIQLIHKLDKLL